MVSVLCDLSKKDDITALLYSETSTLGVRLTYVDRECLPREVVKVRTEHGEVAVKIARFNDKIVNAKPEYDQVREIAERIHKPLKEVEQEVLDKLNNNKSLNAA
jgi:uncharacterized protein (DUF111 family)